MQQLDKLGTQAKLVFTQCALCQSARIGVLPMIGGMGIRGVWLAIALTDAILVAIIAFMVAYEFRKLPATSSVNR